jgi:transposase
LTPDEVSELVAEYEAGMPVRALAARFGLHRGTVLQVVKRSGVTRRLAYSTPAQRKHAAALYEQGYSLSQVAKRVGVSAPTVKAAVLAEGGTIRPKGHVNRRED